jgi:cation diffusion facilitator CzcD-associated flavoprotein CzcO
MDEFDVMVVGAGLSGIGAGYRLQTECPSRSYVILEGRDAIGGTWDLFRYPGIRSDSDMFTLGYPFRPWDDARAIADGGSILRYVRDTAAEFGIDRHIRFGHKVVAARWSSAEARWTVDAVVAGETRSFRCRFLYLCSGYYDYERAHDAQIPGRERFAGRIVHPQWWPQDLDYAGQRVVVIGSGATAVTLVPAMAEAAAHVTMVQRSPTWIASLPAVDANADRIRKVLPRRLAHRVVRMRNAVYGVAMYQFCRRFPKVAGRALKRRAKELLPAGYPVEPDFAPRYDPWDQRLCLVPDADLFRAISAGKASVVTDAIESYTERGLRLASGRELEADLIVTATGLRILAFGGIAVSIDDRPLDPANALVYRGVMLEGVPNAAWCVGYTNASWTLRADLSSRYVCRLLNHMEKHGYDVATPKADGEIERRPLLDLSSGYVTRATDRLPKQGGRAPWYIRQNYLLDLPSMTLGRVTAAMAFARNGPGGPA